MSAFLGPIHYWLYKKIQFQNDLTNKILSEYDKGGLADALTEKYGELMPGMLEDIIDDTNIHGWLQQNVSLVELRFADAVTTLCGQNKVSLSDLERLAFDFGKANQPAPLQSAKQWYSFLNDLLLDGMPCDHANKLISESEDEIAWQRALCVHQSYWDTVSGDISVYYHLRDALINGLMDGSEFIYEKTEDDSFKLKRN